MNIPNHLTNINILWSHLLCTELVRWGVSHVFLSPGYRNVPMMFALDALSGVTRHVCIDERSAAYRALGYAKSSQKPALLVCTSGTAGANYLPALIEAAKEQVPLIAITADRPFEMIHSGANQVVEQQGLYGRFVRCSLSLPAPSTEYAPRMILAYAAHLMEQALMTPPAPVHLNMPFREPLEPSSTAAFGEDTNASSLQAYTEEALAAVRRRASLSVLPPFTTHHSMMAPTVADAIQKQMRTCRQPLLIIGRLCNAAASSKLAAFSHRLGWPVFCDIASGLRGHAPEREIPSPDMAGMTALLDAYQPDMVLHLGRRLVSKQVDAYLSRREDFSYFVVNPLTDIQDPTLRAGAHLIMDEGDFADQIALAETWHPSIDERSVSRLLERTRDLQTGYCTMAQEGPPSLSMVALQIASLAPRDSMLFLGNSATIRAFDRTVPSFAWTADPLASRGIRIAANRGVSGIEGLLSTAIGLALGAPEIPVTAVIGDISLLHDLGALATLGAHRDLSLVVVIANDGGGGIFQAMPAAAFPHIMPYLATPHDFRFAPIARQAGVTCAEVTTGAQLAAAYEAMIKAGCCGVIECLLNQDSTAS